MIISDDAGIHNTKFTIEKKQKKTHKITKQISLEAYRRDSA
jgi:hypothetical protein